MRRLAILIYLFATPLSAQTMQERAAAQMDALGPVTQSLTQGAVEDIVLPFETATPFEASLGPGDLDDAVIATRAGNSTASQAFRATVDSATGRPDITPSNGAMGLANLAVSLGADSVADMFTGDGGSCSNAFDGPISAGTYSCAAPLTQDFRTCRETRRVSVNRQDEWRCTEENPTYRKTCSRDIAWRCTGATGGDCLKQAVRFTRPVTWNAAASVASLSFPGSGSGACALRAHSVLIDIEDIAHVTSLSLSDLSYQGVAQLRVNGQNLWTQGSAGGSDLRIGSRDCGKNCSVDAVYAGNTWIADCGSHVQSRSANSELVQEFTQASPGPNTDLNLDPVTAMMGKRSNQMTVTLITANTRETGPHISFNISGSCCSAFTAEMGATC